MALERMAVTPDYIALPIIKSRARLQNNNAKIHVHNAYGIRTLYESYYLFATTAAAVVPTIRGHKRITGKILPTVVVCGVRQVNTCRFSFAIIKLIYIIPNARPAEIEFQSFRVHILCAPEKNRKLTRRPADCISIQYISAIFIYYHY